MLNTPDPDRPVNRDMAGGLGFDRSKSSLLPPLDLLNYAAVLKRKSHDVILIDGQAGRFSNDALKTVIAEQRPDVLVFTASLPTVDNDIAYAQAIREILPANSRLVCKTAVRLQPVVEKILLESGCDFCIIGECDLVIDEILKRTERMGTAEILNGQYTIEDEILLEDLDSLPVVDRSLLHNSDYSYFPFGTSVTTMQTSRGCPFPCGYYCPYPLVQGERWRSMSAERIYTELFHIINCDKINHVFFRDATFTYNQERIRELCHLIIKNNLQVFWWCETRVNVLSTELLSLMRDAGCRGLNIGVETGNEELLSRSAKQGITLDSVRKISEYCRNNDIILRFLLMIGLPGESRESLYHTFQLVKSTRPDYIGVTTVTPYPGTLFYEDAVKNNWIKNSDINTFGGHGYNVEIGSMKSDDLEFAMKKIYEVHRAITKDEGDARMIEDEFLKWKEK
ncbi:MAG: radical SAM protein [Nitrospira sp.]|nr:radical SAM protein [bacterium]MBL7048030.1 radical SAM protein [Nitrospira sp.]